MPEATSMIPELEDVVQHGTPEKRNAMLRQITTLFIEGADQFNEDHVALFDGLFGKLVSEIEDKARAELSRRLAPIGNAPRDLVRRLAKDDDIAIAGPVLAQSQRLDESDLLAIAASKDQAHLFAISSRTEIGKSITDVLVRRGDRDVVRKLAGNPGAQLSETGYSNIVKRAEKDGVLAETVAQRPDIPDDLFRELLSKATATVQRRLLAAAKPETQSEIRRVLAQIAGEAENSAPARDYTQAVQKMRTLATSGRLDEKQLAEFARAESYEDTVAALGEMARVPVEVVDKLMNGERADPILILCKAMGIDWSIVRDIIVSRPGSKGKSNIALDAAFANFDKLSQSTAQRVVKFWQTS